MIRCAEDATLKYRSDSLCVLMAARCALAAMLVLILIGGTQAFADDPPVGGMEVRQGDSAETSNSTTAQEPTTSGPAATQPARLADDPRLLRWWHTMFWTLIILVVFVSGAIAIIVFSRRYRQYLSQTTRHEKTEFVDVWKMHKVPEDVDIEPDEEEGGSGEGR